MDPTRALALARDPSLILKAQGMTPDPWQRDLLRSPAVRLLVLCSRQAGKSETAAALALHTALLQPGALVLLLSPTLRQSGELFRAKVMSLYTALGRPVAATQETALTLTLANGGVMKLHQNCVFSAVRIEGVSLAPGTHYYSELVTSFPYNFAPDGSGSITVQPYGPPPGFSSRSTSARVMSRNRSRAPDTACMFSGRT